MTKRKGYGVAISQCNDIVKIGKSEGRGYVIINLSKILGVNVADIRDEGCCSYLRRSDRYIANKGSHGVDGMTVYEIRQFIKNK